MPPTPLLSHILRRKASKKPPTTQVEAGKLKTSQKVMPRFSKIGGSASGGLVPFSP